MAYSFNTFISEYSVRVPKLQREFAFGRKDRLSEEKRKRFIDTIFSAISNDEPLYMNFIYGTISRGYFIPLDGQQRLTILFLFHWYSLSITDKKRLLCRLDNNEYVSKFTYDTRYSSNRFFDKLVNFEPEDPNESIIKQIINMPWFELDWTYDANISGCLTVLDYIQSNDTYGLIDSHIDKLNNITFDMIDINAYKMSDDIYIKINSRGKQLTEFENFKAAFIENAKKVVPELHKEIADSFDNEWTMIFWKLIDWSLVDSKAPKKPAEQLDAMLFSFIKYITRVLIWENEQDIDVDISEGYLLISIIDSIYSSRESITTFQDVFIALSSIDEIDDWFNKRFYNSPASLPEGIKRIRLWQKEPNLLRYLATSERLSRNDEALFYAIIVYMQNKGSITDEDFRLRFRSIRNILEAGDRNSYNNTLRDTVDNNDMPTALKQIKKLMKEGSIEDTSQSRLRKHQLEYEYEKNLKITNDNELFEAIVTLEDHAFTHGITQNLGISNIDNLRKYYELLCVGELEFVKILLSFEYSFSSDRYGTIYFPTNTSHYSTFFRGATAIDVELVKILEENAIEAIKSHPNVYIMQCDNNKRFTSHYYAIKYPKHYIYNENYSPYQRGNVRNFNKPGICLTNKTLMKWDSFRNSILLTICTESGVPVEWLDDSSISWNNGHNILRSKEKEFQVIIDDEERLIEVQRNEDNYDFIERVELGVKLLKEGFHGIY
ncbi:MAG: DUF262 domain-containing protein [Oscillospiraceae bacterium]|nr:DUF262 domain-containing protein [Oscillospiraceae bacterium]